ncbi:hypothetical protein [Novosphingobium sp. FKTRR1]|uniref:hypothetical protein n=1 Tax=Novosphingobium sp. FKTRR1 TaxID=2879118 RepID=UPI001CF0922E|nr:hypothetical protein [Novosphingobium sp. FKTRR1]
MQKFFTYVFPVTIAWAAAILLVGNTSDAQPLIGFITAKLSLFNTLGVVAIGVRAAVARDVEGVGSTAAFAAMASGAYVVAGRTDPYLILWGMVNLFGGLWAMVGVVCAWPDVSTNWTPTETGQRYKVKSMRGEKGLFTEHREDSRLRHRVWARENNIYSALILVCVAAVMLLNQRGQATVPSWVAIAVEGFFLPVLGWHQITRRGYLPHEPKPVSSKPDDTSSQQSQGTGSGRRDLS